HAIDEWNGRHSPIYGFYLSLISPSDASASIDIRFCDIAQRHLVAMFLTVDSAVGAELAEFRIALSMCKRLRIPCLLDGLPASIKKNRFLTNVGPTPQMLGQALAQLILPHLLPLFALRRSITGTRVSFRAIQMPSGSTDSELYGLFLKHIRERLRHTNILLYTDDLGTIHSLLEQIRKVELSDATTGERSARIRLNATTGERIDTSLGKWEKSAHRWTFNGKHDERNKWRFRVGPNGTPDLRGERLKVVVYLEEPFVMRKMESFSSASSSPSSPSSFIGRIRSQPSAKINQNQLNRGWPSIESAQHDQNVDEHQQQQFEGFCIDLLKEMAKLLNFTYDIEVVDDGTYGVEDEYGRWNGIIGVLQRHEADLSVSAVTITYSRVSVIDFTLPFMHLGIAILMRRNVADETERSGGTATGGSNLFTFMEPLSFSVWIALAIAYASVASTMWILAKC
uniref:Glutamate receptor n=1 Tax=Globodera pallida TaxID=36090 RepID=A0A183CQ11_GLOPA